MDEGEEKYAGAIDTLFKAFSGVVGKDVIATIVESYDGDVHQAADAIMSITPDMNSHESQPEPTVNISPDSTEMIPTVNNRSPGTTVVLPTVNNVAPATIRIPTVNNLGPGSPPLMLPNVNNIGPQPPVILPITNNIGPRSPGMLPNANYFYSQATRMPQTVNIPLPNPTMSFSQAFQQRLPPPIRPASIMQTKQPTPTTNTWPDQIREIITQYNKGWQILLIMRGPPGCGKSHLAREILQMTVGCTEQKDFNTHILSTDDYFMHRGMYQYDKFKLPDAHSWNKNRALRAMKQGVSPLIIDNTNIEVWEMEPYARMGVSNGYILHVVEPKTSWAKNSNQLFKRNNHNVPIHTIKRMLDNMRDGITGDGLKRMLGLQYPADLKPPVIRKYPVFERIENKPVVNEKRKIEPNKNSENQIPESSGMHVNNSFIDAIENSTSLKNIENSHNEEILSKFNESKPQEMNNTLQDSTIVKEMNDYKEIEKRLEEFEKLEQEWEAGEDWEETSQKSVTSESNATIENVSKPPRRKPTETHKPETLISVTNDWSRFLSFPTNSPNSNTIVEANAEASVTEKKSTETCIEYGDTEISETRNPYKVITATPRDINIFFVEKQEKIPVQRMLDKSTSTNDELISMKPYRCQNEEHHFKAFRKMFRNIPSTDLREIFEKCCGDVNWAVEIVVDGIDCNAFRTDDVESDDDDLEENIGQCECLAAYNIIPDARQITEETPTPKNLPKLDETPSSTPKKRKEISDASIQLKRQIEENVVISDNHYSEHQLKLRNARRPPVKEGNNSVHIIPIELEEPVASTSGSNNNVTTNVNVKENEPSDDESTGSGEIEKTVNVNIGMDLIKQLDKLFGREDMKYPENIVPRINAPLSLLNEINALWMESLMGQLEEDSKQTKAMIDQDAEFARLLHAKEEEMLLAGKEPEIPDFKEIMDMDLAISLYQKDVAEWKNKTPLDLAAKMTREKLYNLFPDVDQEILSELLMAHENNFRNTVEVLLVSTGQASLLEDKNGVSKFVMEKEMERKNKLMEEQRKALSEVEWPLLPKDDVRMEDVEKLRKEAMEHLEIREKNYRKAQEYIQRGMLPVATYYSELGAFHTMLYEQANNRAATSLVCVNAQRCKDNATIDLHNLRVAEARESLDLFLDIHIQKLKEINGKNGVKSHTLFFLTGRGKHSPAGPRVKPAVKKRLRERGFSYYELNPGLLAAKVTASHCLTDDIC